MAEGNATGGTDNAERLVVLDWGLAETVLALGVVPLGVPAPDWYDRYVGNSEMPQDVSDVGLLFAPNFEMIQMLAPSRILITPGLTRAKSMLNRIAPTDIITIYRPDGTALKTAHAGTRHLATLIGHPRGYDILAASVRGDMERARRAVAETAGQPVYLVNVIDDRHVRVYGAESMYGSVLTYLGIRNAWTRPTPVGFVTVALDALMNEPEAVLVVISTPIGGRSESLARSPFWSVLPFAQTGRFIEIAPVLETGGLPAATRFARLLTAALVNVESGEG
jgi:iron complex transport system substrate-binding protein